MSLTVNEQRARYLRNCRLLAGASFVTAVYYVSWLVFEAQPANMVLYVVLIGAELFNITQAAGFWYTISIQRWNTPPDADFSASREHVDAFVTVYGEPADIVEKTVRAVSELCHPRLKVWVLDDGASAEIKTIAKRYGAEYLTREGHAGAKAGNINHALRHARGDYVVIFDADHVPVPSFLERTMSLFSDPAVAFVQTPQAYRNRFANRVAAGAHEQQDLFYGPILRGKDRADAVFSCGTNVVFRRTALDRVGGVPEDSVTEDLRISLLLVRQGWTGRYVPEVLAHGLGPVDVGGFFKQQARWARGGLEILFRRRPFFLGMRPGQVIQFGLSFIFWFTGWAYAGYISLPFAFLVFGLRPVQVPNEYPIHFLPYIFTTLFTLIYASGFLLTFRGMWFTLASFPVHMGAFFVALFRRAGHFVVTSKGSAVRSLAPVWPHMMTISGLAFAVIFGLYTLGATPSVLNNVVFALGHMLILGGFIRLAGNPEVKRAPADAEALAMTDSMAASAVGVGPTRSGRLPVPEMDTQSDVTR